MSYINSEAFHCDTCGDNGEIEVTGEADTGGNGTFDCEDCERCAYSQCRKQVVKADDSDGIFTDPITRQFWCSPACLEDHVRASKFSIDTARTLARVLLDLLQPDHLPKGNSHDYTENYFENCEIVAGELRFSMRLELDFAQRAGTS